MQKRKVSFTFKRENTLDKQERIYNFYVVHPLRWVRDIEVRLKRAATPNSPQTGR